MKKFIQEDWNLKDILYSVKGKDYELFLENLEKNLKQFEDYKKELNVNISQEKFIKIIKLMELIECNLSRLSSFAYLQFSTNTKLQESRAFKDEIQNKTADIENRMLFFTLWFKSLDNKTAENIIIKSKEYSYFLEKLRLEKQYTLSEKEEQIINLKNTTGVVALRALYGLIRSNFRYELKLGNKNKIVNESELVSYVTNSNKILRYSAYEQLLNNNEKNKDVLGDIYINRVSDWRNTNLKIRGYKSYIAPRNLQNDISDKAVETMLKVCKANAGIFHKYFKFKAKKLGSKKLHRYDLYAPLLNKEKNYSYNDSLQIILSCYKSFSPEMAVLALKIINQKHIHSKIDESKLSGAYCYDIEPGITPYVLVNYAGKEKDITTLAHELGHGVHDLLTHKNNALVCHPPLILAETASVFGEMIVTSKLLKDETDLKIKQSLLASKIEDIYATVIRQAFFVLFELEAHKAIENGTTVDKISEIYFNNLKDQFGDVVELPEITKTEWMRIPHIYDTPFYCYSYSFGNLLVLALYQKYVKEGKSFVPKYLKFLSYGGSKKPLEICKELGVDLESEKFWQQGFNFIDSIIEELIKLD